MGGPADADALVGLLLRETIALSRSVQIAKPILPAVTITSGADESIAGQVSRRLVRFRENEYVCCVNGDTQGPVASDPLVRRLAEAIACDRASAVLLVGAPGMGKTAVLTAVADLVSERTRGGVIWISGGVVASEGHLAKMLGSAVGGSPAERSLNAVCDQLAAPETAPVLLAIDDFDDLVFKRESIAKAVTRAVADGSNSRLVASCRPDAKERLINPDKALGAIPGRVLVETGLSLFDPQAARALIERRAPRLSPAAAEAIIVESGGHPAALVFLSRIAGLRNERSDDELESFFNLAGEFAGAVYAEPWTNLGPQQRAILAQIAQTGRPMSAVEVARVLELSPGHVSAQLSRLTVAGLVSRTRSRGHHVVAPLLSRWMSRRAARMGRPSRVSTGQSVQSPGLDYWKPEPRRDGA